MLWHTVHWGYRLSVNWHFKTEKNILFLLVSDVYYKKEKAVLEWSKLWKWLISEADVNWCKICSVTRFLSIYFFCFRGCLDHCCNTSSSSDKLVDFDLQPNGWPGYDETSCWFVEIETAGRRNKMAPERRRGSLCWLLLVLFNMTTIIIHKKTNMNIVIHRMNKAVCCFNKTMEA